MPDMPLPPQLPMAPAPPKPVELSESRGDTIRKSMTTLYRRLSLPDLPQKDVQNPDAYEALLAARDAAYGKIPPIPAGFLPRAYADDFQPVDYYDPLKTNTPTAHWGEKIKHTFSQFVRNLVTSDMEQLATVRAGAAGINQARLGAALEEERITKFHQKDSATKRDALDNRIKELKSQLEEFYKKEGENYNNLKRAYNWNDQEAKTHIDAQLKALDELRQQWKTQFELFQAEETKDALRKQLEEKITTYQKNTAQIRHAYAMGHELKPMDISSGDADLSQAAKSAKAFTDQVKESWIGGVKLTRETDPQSGREFMRIDRSWNGTFGGMGTNEKLAIAAIVDHYAAKGSTRLTVNGGSRAMQHELWVRARMRGMEVTGFTPTKKEVDALEKMMDLMKASKSQAQQQEADRLHPASESPMPDAPR